MKRCMNCGIQNNPTCTLALDSHIFGKYMHVATTYDHYFSLLEIAIQIHSNTIYVFGYMHFLCITI